MIQIMSFVVIVIIGIIITMIILITSQNNHMNKSKELFENLTNFEFNNPKIYFKS
jgi:preprotein translocase subunit YajC